jgi:hypothetical protein
VYEVEIDLVDGPRGMLLVTPTQSFGGSSATFVIQFAGGPCADPSAPDPGPNRTIFETRPVVYDVLGWRRTGDLWLPFELTVPGDPQCLP